MKEIKQGRWSVEEWEHIRAYFEEAHDGGFSKEAGFEEEDIEITKDSILVRCRRGDQQFAELMLDIGRFIGLALD